MKFKLLSISLLAIVLSLCFIASCTDKKPEKKADTKQEAVSEVIAYQCPMDCEDGKTYDQATSCPVCKMDLKAVKSKASNTCTQHKDGKCNCKSDTCACKNCPAHVKSMTCMKHKDGNCSCQGDKCVCANCADHSKAMICNQHKDGNCSCQGDKCACANCAEHSKAMTCVQHKNGKCNCEGEKCECANCAEHS